MVAPSPVRSSTSQLPLTETASGSASPKGASKVNTASPLPPSIPQIDVGGGPIKLGPPTVQSPETLSTASSMSPSPVLSSGADPSGTSSAAASTSASSSSLTKPRSDSLLQSSRPAPASPASSRRASQVVSPQLLATGFPSPSSGVRDRALSTSSSRGGRRVSNGGSQRGSSRTRPRSSLGASSLLASDNGDGDTQTTVTESSLATMAIPEDSVPIEERPDPPVIIRDYAFEVADPRFNGPGLPLSAPDASRSRRSSRWGDSPELTPSGLSSRKNSGWSGFGLLSWRGFMDRRRGSTSSGMSNDNGDEDDYPLPVPDADADDYAFSDSEDEAEPDDAEPWGFYRAAFAFESMGEHEIGLEEGDIVEVRGRGGGEGWVVCVKRKLDSLGRVVRLDDAEGTPGLGLCPESYLERAFEYEVAPSTSSVGILPDIAEHEPRSSEGSDRELVQEIGEEKHAGATTEATGVPASEEKIEAAAEEAKSSV